ncbi:MAG: enoyl-CoA hydratase/isomerase family protein, partial [Deltaproteobacteria bacterium]|nr:enoyl-CoA hydratase/isomerase family protein [Deltaproteobacteria bacterium]
DITLEMADLLRNHNPLTLAMESMVSFPYPTIAMLNGYAYGAGLNLALCCDIRIAADQVSVSMPPVKLGLVYHPEGIRQFIEVVGVPRAREIFFTGRRYSGGEALQIGLVNELVPAEKLASRTYAVASEIASNAPLSLRGIKRIMNMFRNAGCLAEKDRLEAEALMNEAYASRDLLEGQKAFFERRKPNFTGH